MEQQKDVSPIDIQPARLTINPFQELEAAIDSFKRQLRDGAEPLAISQSLTQIQPEEEETWTEQMWQIYDCFYEEVSQLEYQSTFSFETRA